MSLSVVETPALAIPASIVAIDFASKAIWLRKLSIFLTANGSTFATTFWASPLAAHDASFAFFACTVIRTTGFWPLRVRFPGTFWVEMPPRKSPGFALHDFAIVRITSSEWTIAATVAGFVCIVCSWMLPLAEYG
jgi:hypothetical protein